MIAPSDAAYGVYSYEGYMADLNARIRDGIARLVLLATFDYKIKHQDFSTQLAAECMLSVGDHRWAQQ